MTLRQVQESENRIDSFTVDLFSGDHIPRGVTCLVNDRIPVPIGGVNRSGIISYNFV